MLLPHAISDSILIALSGLVGFFGLSSAPRFATFILAVPVLWGLASDRKSAFAVMFAYFLTVSRGLLTGAAVFLCEHHLFDRITDIPQGFQRILFVVLKHLTGRKAAVASA